MAHSICNGEQGRVSHFRRMWDTLLAPDADLWSKLEVLFARETTELDLEYGFFSRIDTEAGTERFEVVHGDNQHIRPETTVPLSETYCRKTLEEPDGMLVVDDALAEGWADDPAYQKYGLRTYIGTTVETEGRVYGTLCFASDAARSKPIHETERKLVEMYGQWVTYELEQWAGPPTEDTVVSTDQEALSQERIDVMLEALGNRIRRRVLLELLTGTVESCDVFEAAVGGEDAATVLYHTHFPKLADAGYIEWDRREGTVSRGPTFHEVEPLLELLADRSADRPDFRR